MTMMKRFFLFGLVNILMVVTISVVLAVFGIGPYMSRYGINYESLAAFCLVWGMGGAFFSLAISRLMAKWMMGVQVINPDMPGMHSDLVQTVYRLARAANLPKMPQVGVYDSPEVNAFATGPSRSRSLVAVSSGLLQSMNRNEIEGVLSHEIAHIANGDMVTMTLIQGVVNAFVMFFSRIAAFAISNALSNRDDRRGRGTGSPMMFHLLNFVFEILFGMLGMILVARFSRWREFRADAGGAAIGGRENMKSALQRLLANSRGNAFIDNSHESLAAFKISGNPSKWLALFSTHPSLEERIRRLS